VGAPRHDVIQARTLDLTKVRHAMRERSIDDAALAKRLGIKESNLRAVTHGHREVAWPSIVRLASAIGVDPVEITFAP